MAISRQTRPLRTASSSPNRTRYSWSRSGIGCPVRIYKGNARELIGDPDRRRCSLTVRHGKGADRESEGEATGTVGGRRQSQQEAIRRRGRDEPVSRITVHGDVPGRPSPGGRNEGIGGISVK